MRSGGGFVLIFFFFDEPRRPRRLSLLFSLFCFADQQRSKKRAPQFSFTSPSILSACDDRRGLARGVRARDARADAGGRGGVFPGRHGRLRVGECRERERERAEAIDRWGRESLFCLSRPQGFTSTFFDLDLLLLLVLFSFFEFSLLLPTSTTTSSQPALTTERKQTNDNNNDDNNQKTPKTPTKNLKKKLLNRSPTGSATSCFGKTSSACSRRWTR